MRGFGNSFLRLILCISCKFFVSKQMPPSWLREKKQITSHESQYRSTILSEIGAGQERGFYFHSRDR